MTTPSKKRLTGRVAFRIEDDVVLLFKEKAAAAGMTPSEFFRDCVLNNKTTVVHKTRASADKKHLLYLTNKASNNLNQLAYRAHRDHNAGILDSATYRQILAELEQIGDSMKHVVNHVD